MHETCHHEAYRLSCADFDELCARAAGRCEVCGIASEQLWIDHDHSIGYTNAVRGLVCPKCNAALRRIDSGERPPSSDAARYLARGVLVTRAISPGRSRTGTRVVRVPDDEWRAAQAAAAARGETLTDVIRAALRRYTARHGSTPPPESRSTQRPHRSTGTSAGS